MQVALDMVGTALKEAGIGFWAKFVIIAVAAFGTVAATAYVTHTITAAKDEKAQKIAIDDVNKDWAVKVNEEREKRLFYQGMVNGAIKDMQAAVLNLKTSQSTIQTNITREVETNPTFYTQPLPDGGDAQWKAIRKMLKDSAGQAK